MCDYATEADLVDDLILGLGGVVGAANGFTVGREFDYQRGRTDIVVSTDAFGVVAFEAKLLRWRLALQQAYRNTCFAHRSYVALPEQVAERARRFEHEFRRRAVGLCSVSDAGVRILVQARHVDPIEPWLTVRARSIADSQVVDAA